MLFAAPSGIDEDLVSPGVLGLLVVVALGLALVFLIRSMNKQISRIQAPREADLDQAEWDRRQANARAARESAGGSGDAVKGEEGPRD
ncbi:hypothetical protein HKK74_16780 [Actinomadura alba]|uniref:Uncharacterized protein n=1 Tax=Actinomadura alba TaxID=406431 RepID=A0ABR7LQM0_9ACTN|nr:hypothetical protein [Actinomadura alba]